MAPIPSTKLSLPDVTLVMIDTDGGELAKKALSDTLNLITPGEVLIFTDSLSYPVLESDISNNWGRTILIPDIESSEEYGRILWHQVPQLVTTSHILVIQWDGWVINPSMWQDDYLSYDYIGAVWPWHQINRVGNGGFSLRSTKLMKHLSEWKSLFPRSHEDDSLCRVHRQYLESFGFRWAHEGIANCFSSEHQWFPGFGLPFGFHDCRNWTKVMAKDQLLERLRLCEQNSYIKSKPEYQELKTFVNWLNTSLKGQEK